MENIGAFLPAWTLLITGLMSSADADEPGPADPLSGQYITVHEDGTKLSCRIITTWPLTGGGQGYQVQNISNGEYLTLIGDGQLAGNAYLRTPGNVDATIPLGKKHHVPTWSANTAYCPWRVCQ